MRVAQGAAGARVLGAARDRGRFGHLAGLRVVVDPARAAQTVNVGPPVTIATPGERVRDVWLTNGTPQNTADDTQLVAGGAVVAGCAPVDLATTDFTRRTATRTRSPRRG